MAELLLELLSEEIPARMQARAAEDLKRLVGERLKAAGLAYKDARAYVTPRRLALVVTGLPKKQPDTTEEKKGPRLDAPEKAIKGFLKSNGLKSLKQAEVRDTGKGEFYFAVKRAKGQATAKVLPGVIAQSVQALPWPKSMRWADGEMRWVRPLHGALATFDGTKLSGALELGHGARVRFGNTTFGHRFLAPKKITVKGFADYKKKLKTAKVMLDQGERRAVIVKQAKQAAARAKLKVKDDPALLDEVAGLVEWPVVLMGTIDKRFMDLPPEVLTTAMRAHQKYLALLDKNGKPANRFLVVANMTSTDKGKAIVAGNERVLRARLADARFFWDQDRKTPLAARAPQLRDIVFHAKLGSLDDKIDRVQALAVEIASYVGGAEKDRVRSAARLAKADLVTGMVGEFPELQGVIGRYYALADGEHEEVAVAISEHYAPQGPSDACPSAPVSVALALADKLDTLVGMFAIDEKPTGSKDPFALRRAALGVIRIVVENRIRLPLRQVVESANKLVTKSIMRASREAAKQAGGAQIIAAATVSRTVAGWGEIDRDVLAVLDFFADRLKVALREKGVRHDLISAVFAVGGEDDLVRLLARVEALEAFLKTDDGANLLVAYQRSANIVRIEAKKDQTAYKGRDLRVDQLKQAEEKRLYACISEAEDGAANALEDEDFTGAMAALAKLRHPIDEFFDRVTVNTDDTDLRANRLCLLSRIDETLDRVADFSKIEG
ncbi:MAG: glycine--tRNA ligase subunit beta [Kiloniellales bacterium]